MPTAILVDGDYFLKRYQLLLGKQSPEVVAEDLHAKCIAHLKQPGGPRNLYRIFFYTCPPLTKRVHNPISLTAIDFSKTELAAWRTTFLDELRKKRKVALRLGYLNDRIARWTFTERAFAQLMSRTVTLDNLTAADVFYLAPQKGVDMRIGLDIAALAFKRQVDQIILISGDSDFVPAAKLARREGIDFVLDPIWGTIRDDLAEHVDGLISVFPKSKHATQ